MYTGTFVAFFLGRLLVPDTKNQGGFRSAVAGVVPGFGPVTKYKMDGVLSVGKRICY